MARLLVGLSVAVALAAAWVVLAPAAALAEPLSVDALTKPVEPAPQQYPEIGEAFNRLRSGDIDGAYEGAKAAVKKYPELPPAEVVMTQFFAMLKQEPTARAWLERAVQENPTDPEAYMLLGQDAAQANRFAEANLLTEKANALLGSFSGNAKRKEGIQSAVLLQSARLAMLRKDWAAAQTHLEALLKLRANNAVALQMLGQALFEQQKPDEALEKLKAAKAADEKVLTPEATMADWYERAKNHAKAGEFMVAALTAQPKDFATRLAAAQWAFNAREFAQARQQIDIALTQDPNSVNAKLLAGGIAIFQKDYPAAEKYLKSALDVMPSSFAASNNLAVALAEQNDAEKQKLALQYAQINARLYPKEEEPFSTLGRVLFRLGRNAEAEQMLGQAVNVARSNGTGVSPDTAYYFAELYAQTNRKDDAKKILQDALKKAEKSSLFASRKEAEELLQKLSQ